MAKQENLSTLSLAILGLIAVTPRSGYDLKKEFMTSPIGNFSSSPGAIYPALKRCERSGWIAGEIDQASLLRPRQLFRLTVAGREVLKRELVRQVTVEDVIWRQDDLILRFAFMDAFLSARQILTFLDQYLAAMSAYVKTLKAHRNSMAPDVPRCGALALEQGIAAYDANVRWARGAIRRIRGARG